MNQDVSPFKKGFHRSREDIKKRARSAPAHVDTRDFDAGDLFLLLHLAILTEKYPKNQKSWESTGEDL